MALVSQQALGKTTTEVAPSAAQGPWALETDGPAGIARVELRAGEEVIVGSGEQVDLQVADRTISARHLRVRVLDGGVQVEDLNSKNGLFIGAARVRSALVTGADTKLSVGRTVVTLLRVGDVSQQYETMIPGLVGSSAAMRRLAESIERYAPLSAPVLIQGESGTGKDLVARALHRLAGRRGPYVPLNCGSLVESLADSELFGHCRGAFTGAVAPRVGAFQQAHQGTLFLDEVGELAAAVQAKLLRVIEDGEVRPVGSTSATQVQVRLISATWRSLPEAAERGEFRSDLLHRLGMVVLRVPPLRQRKSDIPALCAALLKRISHDVGEKQLSRAALDELCEYNWPGNVRELRSVLYRAAVCAERDEIERSDVQTALPQGSERRVAQLTSLQARELLRQAGGNVSRAARAAQVARSTFRSWLARTDEAESETALELEAKVADRA